jgi:predicted nucleotidyltransferase
VLRHAAACRAEGRVLAFLWMSLRIQVDEDALAELCRRRGIRRLSFFGSVLREDFSPRSDVDILVEFESDRTPGLDFFAIEDELSSLLGRKVDLQTPGFLSHHIRERVMAEAEPRYVAA